MGFSSVTYDTGRVRMTDDAVNEEGLAKMLRRANNPKHATCEPRGEIELGTGG